MVQRHTCKENSHPHKIKSQNKVEIKSPREIPGKVLGGYAQGLGFNSFKIYLKIYNEMNSIFISFFKNLSCCVIWSLCLNHLNLAFKWISTKTHWWRGKHKRPQVACGVTVPLLSVPLNLVLLTKWALDGAQGGEPLPSNHEVLSLIHSDA